MMYSPQQFQFNQAEEVTIYKVQNLELALQKAMENISELQTNLSFMIKYNEEIKQESLIQQRKLSKTIQSLQQILHKRDRQLSLFKDKHQQYESLLFDTKQALNISKQSMLEKQQLIQRYQRIIQEQKNTISSLEDELLNNKYNEVSVNQSNQSYFVQIQDLEKQLQDFDYQNKRLTNNLQKQSKRAIQLQKQNQQFKTWLAQVAGIRKVVPGCQRVLMTEVARKAGLYKMDSL